MSTTLVLGGTRSGKSAVAERLTRQEAARTGQAVTYLATATIIDDNMAQRVATHRDRRPPSWSTVEVEDPSRLTAVLSELPGVVLLDSLGTWLARHDDFVVDAAALTGALAARRGPTVVVSEEVGLAVHPPSAVGRLFVDALGSLNQAVAARSERAVLVVAGRVLEL